MKKQNILIEEIEDGIELVSESLREETLHASRIKEVKINGVSLCSLYFLLAFEFFIFCLLLYVGL